MLNLILFWYFTAMDPEFVQKWEVLPASLFITLLIVFLLPFNVFHKNGRYRFLKYAEEENYQKVELKLIVSSMP